jgi:hypothetical protein
VACTSDTPTATDARIKADLLGGRAVAALDGSGRFVLSTAAPQVGQVDARQAEVLATAYEHTFGRQLVAKYNQDRGGAPIAIDRTVACGRTYLAVSPYADLPPTTPANALRFVSAKWLVTLCDGAQAVVSVAVSVYASDVQVREGRIVSQPAPNDFSGAAIPIGGAMPMTPEQAVQMAARATHRRITEVPELVLPSVPYAPQLARWRLTLDTAVTLHGERSGKRRSSAEVLVGFGRTSRTLALGAHDADSTRVGHLRGLAPDGRTRVSLTLVGKPGYPTAFEEVEVEP